VPNEESASTRSSMAAATGTARIRKRPRSWLLLKVALALFVLALLIAGIGWRQVIEAFAGLNLWWIPVLLLLRLLRILLQSERWRLFLVAHRIKVSRGRLFRSYLVSRLFNNLFPGQIGGDAYRVLRGLDSGEKKTELTSSVIMERASGLIGLTLVAAISGCIYFPPLQAEGLAALPLLAGAACALLIALTTRRSAVVLARRGARYVPGARIRSIADAILGDLVLHVERHAVLMVAIVIGAAYYILAAIETYLAFRAFGVHVDLFAVMVVSPIVALTSSIPITINGWGITEAASVLLYTQLGVSAPEAFATALLGRINFLVMAVVGGLIYLADVYARAGRGDPASPSRRGAG
jgi:glycosyltransferase 2 family protein